MMMVTGCGVDDSDKKFKIKVQVPRTIFFFFTTSPEV